MNCIRILQEKKYNSMSPISKLKQKKIYLLFLLIMVPVFISLDISEGLRFDTSAKNNPKKYLRYQYQCSLFLFYFY